MVPHFLVVLILHDSLLSVHRYKRISLPITLGGCNSCKCNKYYSDKKRNKNTANNYGKLVLRILLPPFAILMLCIILIGELDDTFNGLSEFFYGIAFFVTFVHFTIVKPLDKIQNKILSR